MNIQSQKVEYCETCLKYDMYYFKSKAFLAFYEILTEKLYNGTAPF